MEDGGFVLQHESRLSIRFHDPSASKGSNLAAKIGLAPLISLTCPARPLSSIQGETFRLLHHSFAQQTHITV